MLLDAGITIAQPGLAACPGPDEIRRYVEDWQAKRPAKAPPVADMKDAACAQGKVVEAMGPTLGKVVGYKVGLTSKATQERFGTNAPVAGVLLQGMILDSGASVPAAFGARPVWEADMLLVVKDEGINQAKTLEEALRHISAMRPFIELPDLALAPSEKLDGIQLTAINVAARVGVAGPEVPLEPGPETVQRLADVRIIVTDATGAKLAEGAGSATLGNPLGAVVWLVEELGKHGQKLSAGDLISVGSFTPLTPPKPGQEVTATYEGLPGTPKVSVKFH